MMSYTITVTGHDRDQLALLARAWNVDEGEVVHRLLLEFLNSGKSRGPEEEKIPIHATYREVRTDALFDPRTQLVTITTGPLAGSRPKKPSGAAIDVVRTMNPDVQPERNGWTFWRISDTGETLDHLRSRSK